MSIETNLKYGDEVLVKATITGKYGELFRFQTGEGLLTYIFYAHPSVISNVVLPESETPQYSFGTEKKAPENHNLIELAIEQGALIQFEYDKGNGAVETRRVEPSSLFSTRAGNKLVGAYDYDYDDEYKAFRLDRIVGQVEVI